MPEATYREAVTAFHTALAALETSQEPLARQKLDRVIALVPQEPAGWANLGLLLLRQQENGPAKERFVKAAELAPQNAAIERLLAIAESRAGNSAESIRHWRRALELDAGDARRPTRWPRRSSGRARRTAMPRRSARSRRCSRPATTCRRGWTRSAWPPSAATPPA